MAAILVTGGAGFIGANFVYYMLENHPSDRVICVDSLTYAGNLSTLKKALEDPRFVFYRQDIRDRQGVDALPVPDVLAVEDEAGVLQGLFQGGEIPGIGQAVHTDHPVRRVVFQHVVDKVRADEAGAAGDKYCCHTILRKADTNIYLVFPNSNYPL